MKKILMLFIALALFVGCGKQETVESENPETQNIEVKREEEQKEEKENGPVAVQSKEEKEVTEEKSENITVQGAIGTKESNNSYRITNVYNAQNDEMLGDLTLSLANYEGEETFEEGDVVEITGNKRGNTITASAIQFISKASGYGEGELENANQDPGPAVGDLIVVNGLVLDVSPTTITLESVNGDLQDDMAVVSTDKDYSGEISAGGYARVSGTFNGYEGEGILIHATGVFPE